MDGIKEMERTCRDNGLLHAYTSKNKKQFIEYYEMENEEQAEHLYEINVQFYKRMFYDEICMYQDKGNEFVLKRKDSVYKIKRSGNQVSIETKL